MSVTAIYTSQPESLCNYYFGYSQTQFDDLCNLYLCHGIHVGTVSFTNPRARLDVLEGIEQFMEKEGIEDIAELIGTAQR